MGRRRWIIPAVLLILLAALLLCRQGHNAPEQGPVSLGSAAMGLMLLDETGGVYVLAVTEGSPADGAGIRPGDLIIQADGQAVLTAEALDELISGRETLTLTLLRDGENKIIRLPGR